MSAALIPPFDAGTEVLPRKRFTREDVERLMSVGFLRGSDTNSSMEI